MPSKLVRLTLRGAAAAVVVALVVLLGSQWAHRAHGVEVPHARRVGPATSLLDSGCPGGRTVVELLLQRLDLRENAITITPTLCVPQATLFDLAAPLHSGDLFGPVVPVMQHDAGTLGSPAVRSRYANARIRLLVFDADAVHEQDVPLKLLYRSGFDYLNFVDDRVRSVQPFSVTLAGKDVDYPFDAYSTDISVTVYLDGLVRRSGIKVGDLFELPSRVAPAVGADLRGYRIVASRGSDPTDVTIRLSRAPQTQEYVLALLLIPLLLIAVLARATKGRRGGTETIVGGAAVMLALLPIRTVLVPSDIGSLTLVDWGLGLEVALLALLVVWRETSA